MTLEKTYYLKENGRIAFIFLELVIISALLFFSWFNYKKISWELDFDTLKYLIFTMFFFYFAYKGIKKLLTLIKSKIPYVEIYDTHLKIIIYRGRYINGYRFFFSNLEYILINYSDIQAIYKNKKFFNSGARRRTGGMIFLKGIIENNEIDIPTLITGVDRFDLINLKQRLEKKNVDVKELL